MWTDLRQFFTEKEQIELDMSEPAEFIEAVAECYPQKQINDFVDNLIRSELDVMYVQDLETIDFHVFRDNFGNDLMSSVLATFIDENDFEVYELGSTLEMMYSEEDEQFTFAEIILLPMQVRKYVLNFFERAVSDATDSKGNYDEYNAQNMDFRVRYVKFMNKSKARKIRKLYEKDEDVKEMFLQLGYFFENGQLLYIAYAWMDTMGYYDDYFNNVEDAIAGLYSLRNAFGKARTNDASELVEVLKCENFDNFQIIRDLNLALDTKDEVII